MRASSRRKKVLTATTEMVRLAVRAAELVEPLPYGIHFRNQFLDAVIILAALRKQLGGGLRELDLERRVMIELSDRWPS